MQKDRTVLDSFQKKVTADQAQWQDAVQIKAKDTRNYYDNDFFNQKNEEYKKIGVLPEGGFLNEQELQQHQAEMAQQNGGMQNGGGAAPVVNPKTAFGAQPGAKPSIGKIVRGASPAMAMK